MSTPDLDALTQHLIQKHGCHTLILYGSFARGQAGPASDIDVLGFCDSTLLQENSRDTSIWEGRYLDLFVYPVSKALESPADFLHVRNGKILIQRDGFGTQFLEALSNEFRKLPLSLSESESEARKQWARKMLQRASLNDIEGNYRLHWLLFTLLEDYFALRKWRYPGPKRALLWLAHYEPDAWRAFDRALAPGSSPEVQRELVEAVIRPDPISIRRVNQGESGVVQSLLDAAPNYFLRTEGVPTDPHGAESLFQALPPNCLPEQKFVFLMDVDGRSIGVIDTIWGYPDRDTLFIGLFLIAETEQAKGWGRIFYRKLEAWAALNLEVKQHRLAVVDSNPVEKFWTKLGFISTDITKPHDGLHIKSLKRVLLRELPNPG